MTNLVYFVRDIDGYDYNVFNIGGRFVEKAYLVEVTEEDCPDEIRETRIFPTFSLARKYIRHDIEDNALAIQGYDKSDLKYLRSDCDL